MVRRFTGAAAAILFLSFTAAVESGGWTVITLKNVPTHARVGQQGLIYTVRQHGLTPMNDLTGSVVARKGSQEVRATARPLSGGPLGGPSMRSPGAYVVEFRLPEAGTWTIELVAGSGLVGDTLAITLDVLPQGAAEPAVTAVERGRRLFEGKGCVTCHNHPEFNGRRTVNVSDMADKRYTPEFVQAYLMSLPPRRTGEPGAKMPNLGLAQQEVEALAAFLGR